MEFGSADEAQQAFDDWLRRHTPPKVQVYLAAFEAEHLARFLNDYGRAADQFSVMFDQSAALVDQVNFIDKSGWPQHRSLQFIVLAKNLQTFHSALDRLSKGSYRDAMSLTRTIYETFLRVVFISLYSDDPWGVLVDNPGKGKRRFNATNLVREDLRIDWRLYRIMSTYPHSNILEIHRSLLKIQTRSGEPERFGLSYEDDVTLVEAILPILQFLTYVYLRFVREVLVGTAEVPDPQQLAEADEALKWGRFLVANLPKQFWSQVIDDVDYLFHILEIADTGGGWEAVRDLRPKCPNQSPPT